MNLTKALGTVGGLTLASRILGLLRDNLFARFVGAGFASDAFLIAFKLPNMFRALFAEGAFSSAFIPMFNQKTGDPEGPGLKAGLAFAEQALAVLLPVLLVMTLLLEAGAWYVTLALSGKFHGVSDNDFAYAVLLARCTIPYLMLISLVALFGGILNSLHKFWVNAAAPILLNVTLIAALLLFHHDDPKVTAYYQAVGVSVAGLVQLLWLAWACRKNEVSLKFRRPRLTPEIKKLLSQIWPAAAGAGAVQINLVISTALAASLLPHGSVTYIYMADRLNQLPLGLIGIGLGTVLLPTISRQLSAGQEKQAMTTQNRGLELALLLTLPATVALIVCGEAIAAALFGYGRYTPEDTHATAQALAAFSIGLPAYVLIKVLTPGYYARHDTKTPVRFALIAMGVNLALNLALIPTIAHIGPPLATAASAVINLGLLYHTLVKRGDLVADAQLKRRAWRLGVAALLMGAVLWPLQVLFIPYVHGTWIIRGATLAVLVGTGCLVYGAATMIMRTFTLAELKAQFSRRKAG
jgi:putative peptidoglycan lipid II flippase